ncbi:MAG TPA: hypothetical protein VI916_07200, partial [Acidimicrobiia bacterium]|nr:hypothetical protein [Acidimicrobiia bacterium]
MSPRSRSYQPAVSDYLFDLRRGWRVVAGSVLALAIFAVAISATQDEVYRASSDLLLQQAPSRATLISGTSREISTELELARSRRVEKLAVDSLGFRPAVSFHRISDTALIRVTAEASTAAKAARAADAYARAFIEARSSQVLGPLASVRDELQSKLDEVTLADSGTAPASDVDPAAVDDLVALAESVRAAAADGDPGDLRSAIASLQRTLGPGQSDASIRIIRGASLQLLIDEIDAAESLSRNAAPDLVSEAEIPDSPSRPAPARNLVLAIALGVIAGVC